MTYFNCPHCNEPYDEYAMLQQEHVLIEDPTPLNEKTFYLVCNNCLDDFSVIRQITVTFKVQDRD